MIYELNDIFSANTHSDTVLCAPAKCVARNAISVATPDVKSQMVARSDKEHTCLGV